MLCWRYFLPGGFCSEPKQQKYSEINGGDAFPGNGEYEGVNVMRNSNPKSDQKVVLLNRVT